MGGVAGHMDHLYDDRDLTFSKMKEIILAASRGEIKAEEKVDGQNLFLSYSISDGNARAARNLTNIKAGGMIAAELAEKFAGRGGLLEAFTQGFAAFEKAVALLSDEQKVKAFGDSAYIELDYVIPQGQYPLFSYYLRHQRVTIVQVIGKDGQMTRRGVTQYKIKAFNRNYDDAEFKLTGSKPQISSASRMKKKEEKNQKN